MKGSSVKVVVPYRGDSGGPRDVVWSFVDGWWSGAYPGYEVLVGAPFPPTRAGEPEPTPWVKATAVAAALALPRPNPDDILIIADADVLPGPDLERAVAMVGSGRHAWAMPHRRVHRLTPLATEKVLSTGFLPDPPPVDLRSSHRPRAVDPTLDIHESHNAAVGGGMVVLPMSLYEQCPLDPRFEGWGQEDTAWGMALTVLAGPPWKGHDPLWHLWHPKMARGRGLSGSAKTMRGIGSRESLALFHRYRRANTPDKVRALIAEFAPSVC